MIDVIELFAGIGGFSLGLDKSGGFKTVAMVEIKTYCQKLLKQNFPDAEIHSNVTNFKYKKNVGLVTAGFPCQDISHAGEGAGLSGDRSGLFWYILRTACMVGRPTLLLENVAALLTRGLCTVLGALASFGYDAEWHCVPASHVGAPHRRDRIWIVAHPQCERLSGYKQEGQGVCSQSRPPLTILGDRKLYEGYGSLRAGVRRKVDGLPRGVDRVEAIGNSIYPEIAKRFGDAIKLSLNVHERKSDESK